MSAGPADNSGVTAVLASGGNSAADMPFCFVLIQDFFYFKIKASVIEWKPLLDVFMYSALTDTEFFGGIPHSGAIFDDIGGQFAGPFFYITLQDPTRSLSRYASYICGRVHRHTWIECGRDRIMCFEECAKRPCAGYLCLRRSVYSGFVQPGGLVMTYVWRHEL